jgi:HlyD family secretion protein
LFKNVKQMKLLSKFGTTAVDGLCITFFSILLIALTIWVLSPASPNKPVVAPLPQVSTVIAGPAKWTQTIHVSGTLVARDEIAIGTSLQGQRVIRVLVEAGDVIQKGQLLAELENTGQSTQVRQAEAALKNTQAEMREKEIVHKEAQENFQRIEPLGAGPVSAQQIDERRAQAGATLASLQATQAEVESALAHLAESRDQMSKTQIRAPSAGLILERSAHAGALAGAEPLFRLVNAGQIEFDGEISEADLAFMRLGTSAMVSVTGQPMTFAGHVRLMSPRIDPQSRLGKIRIALLEAHDVFRTGAFAQAQLDLGRRTLAIALPLRAVSMDDVGRASVMLVKGDGKIVHRDVVIGIHAGDQVEIVSGLHVGERVVATALAFVRHGDVVAVASEKDRAP